MPFASKAQRRYLWANYPDIAREFEEKTPKDAPLPERKGKTRLQKAKDTLRRGMQGKKR